MLQVNIEYVLESYKIYMLLHRSDLNVSANFINFVGVFNIRTAKSFAFFQISSRFSLIWLKYARIFSDFVENVENRRNSQPHTEISISI